MEVNIIRPSLSSRFHFNRHLRLSARFTRPYQQKTKTTNTNIMASSGLPRVRIAVVGDTHDQWDPIDDARALRELKPDLVLFTGDFGNENLELVENVSKLDFPKAAILGNHDCWNTADFYRSNPEAAANQSEREPDVVDHQIQSLEDCHVGYKRKDFPEIKVTVVGGRPFSTGGATFGPAYEIVKERFGVQGMNQSADKIANVALEAPTEHVLVFLGHNGPKGLGSTPSDICGKDWSLKNSADHGDPDLASALKLVKEKGSHKIPLVVFGHMHKRLAHGRGLRKMLVTGEDNIMYVNAAVVPRVFEMDIETDDHGFQTKRHFTVIDMAYGKVTKIAETWVGVGESVAVVEEDILYSLKGDNVSLL